eukprot:m.99362 g.99362  ORF g.99362 m.99362 type:complete len:1315 (-) comp15332_c1_seq1:111-4055(-)
MVKQARDDDAAGADAGPPVKRSRDRLQFWRERLADLAFLQLPTDFPRGEQAQIDSEETLDLSETTCKALLKYSMEQDVLPFTVVVAALSMLLHKYTREESIAIGSSSSSSNPTILRFDVKDTMDLGEHVRNTKAVEEDSEANDVPFEQLLTELYPTQQQRDHLMSLFQVRVFNVVDVGEHTLDAAQCDWTVFVEQVADAKRLLPLRLRVVFNTVLYARERITDVLRQMELAIKAIVGSPLASVGSVSVLTKEVEPNLPDPRATLDDTWEGPIFEHLSRRAETDPERVFIVHGTTTYTYKHIDAMSNRVANCLVASGIKPEDRVALYAHRSTAIVIGIMGILKSGATFTVIDPAYPVKRQTVYLEVSQPRGIITLAAAGKVGAEVQEYIDSKLKVCCQVNGVDPDALGPLEQYPDTPCGVKVGPDSIGTLSFTSGSTGVPKAVRGRHISLTHFYPWMATEFGMGEHDRFSMLSGIAHDPIQRDVFTPIFFGAQIHIPDAEDIGNPGALAKWVAEHEVTVTHLTPAMGQLLTANADTPMPSLRTALFVGDVLTKRDILRLQRLATNVTAVNMYGTTETQRAVTFMKIENRPGVMSVMKEILPAGRGMKDVQLLVINDCNNLGGIGELGELYVRSPHLSAGYMGLPDATAAKFVTNPFTNDPKDRMYKTGDMGRFLHNGIVECIGRADDQVKIRGFRIELGEIDTYIGQHPSVRETKTLVMRDAHEEKQIISFFVPMKKSYSIEKIRQFLATKLPTYAIPSVLCPLAKMPLNPNGKVDKTKLPYPDTAIILAQRAGASMQDVKEAVSKATPLQRELMSIWEEALGRPVLPDDNFFDVGGHSIMATRVTFAMRTALKQELPLNLLYQFPSIRKLSEAIETSREDPSAEIPSTGRENAETVDPEVEVVLDVSIALRGRTYTHNPNPKTFFLTGATGFLGAFLLSDILKRFANSVVICLVRANCQEHGVERVVDNLKRHLLWDEAFQSRIEVSVGDLSKPLFGLAQKNFEALAERVEVIFHNGAMVHWVYPYSKLKPMNVNGTIEILRLSTTGTTIAPVSFVSSTSVFDSAYYVDRKVPVREDDNLAGGTGLSVGYGQSKWIAEKLMKLAASRGLPTTIFRPGYVTGHSTTGVMNTDDFLVRLLKGCLQMGKVPKIINQVNMCSVDFVAQAIVHVGTRATSAGKAFHICNSTPMRFSEYFSALIEHGYGVANVDYLDWRASLMRLTLESKDNALYPLLHFVLDDLPSKSLSPQLSRTELDQGLVNSGIRDVPIQELMATYVSFLVHIGYLEAPPAGAGKPLPKIEALPADMGSFDRTRKL